MSLKDDGEWSVMRGCNKRRAPDTFNTTSAQGQRHWAGPLSYSQHLGGAMGDHREPIALGHSTVSNLELFDGYPCRLRSPNSTTTESSAPVRSIVRAWSVVLLVVPASWSAAQMSGCGWPA